MLLKQIAGRRLTLRIPASATTSPLTTDWLAATPIRIDMAPAREPAMCPSGSGMASPPNRRSAGASRRRRGRRCGLGTSKVTHLAAPVEDLDELARLVTTVRPLWNSSASSRPPVPLMPARQPS